MLLCRKQRCSPSFSFTSRGFGSCHKSTQYIYITYFRNLQPLCLQVPAHTLINLFKQYQTCFQAVALQVLLRFLSEQFCCMPITYQLSLCLSRIYFSIFYKMTPPFPLTIIYLAVYLKLKHEYDIYENMQHEVCIMNRLPLQSQLLQHIKQGGVYNQQFKTEVSAQCYMRIAANKCGCFLKAHSYDVFRELRAKGDVGTSLKMAEVNALTQQLLSLESYKHSK